jgi:hypothetical protein
MCIKDDFYRTISQHTKKAPIFGAELARMYKISGQQVRELVNELRRDSKPVCSSNRGYWRAQTIEERDQTVRELEGRLQSLQLAVDGLKRAPLGNIDIQKRIFENLGDWVDSIMEEAHAFAMSDDDYQRYGGYDDYQRYGGY